MMTENSSCAETPSSAASRLRNGDRSLKEIKLVDNKYSDAVVRAMVDALLLHPNCVERVLVWNNRLTDKSGTKFARFVATSSGLEQLDLSNNQIGDVTHLALADSLRHNSSLRRLDLWSDDGRGHNRSLCDRALVESLRLNPHRPDDSRWQLYTAGVCEFDRLKRRAAELGHPPLAALLLHWLDARRQGAAQQQLHERLVELELTCCRQRAMLAQLRQQLDDERRLVAQLRGERDRLAHQLGRSMLERIDGRTTSSDSGGDDVIVVGGDGDDDGGDDDDDDGGDDSVIGGGTDDDSGGGGGHDSDSGGDDDGDEEERRLVSKEVDDDDDDQPPAIIDNPLRTPPRQLEHGASSASSAAPPPLRTPPRSDSLGDMERPFLGADYSPPLRARASSASAFNPSGSVFGPFDGRTDSTASTDDSGLDGSTDRSDSSSSSDESSSADTSNDAVMVGLAPPPLRTPPPSPPRSTSPRPVLVPVASTVVVGDAVKPPGIVVGDDQRVALAAGSPPTVRVQQQQQQQQQQRQRASSSTAAAAAAAAATGGRTPIKSWKKVKRIGEGAFGKVWLGFTDSGCLVAVKRIKIPELAKRDQLDKLEEEVRMHSSFDHPHIVRYLDCHRDDTKINIFLEFCPGGSIHTLLQTMQCGLSESVIRVYTKQILLGLEYLHQNGIIHRDIKGANILVDRDSCVKLADFGCSKALADFTSTHQAKTMTGSPYWMAPEVLKSQGYGPSADIWSLGCTIIEMATGKPPLSELEPLTAMFRIGKGSTPPIPDFLSEDAHEFLGHCLQRRPEDRYTCAKLLQLAFVVRCGDEPTEVDLDEIDNVAFRISGNFAKNVITKTNDADSSSPPTLAPTSIAELPREALYTIFAHLTVAELSAVRLVCRAWNALVCHREKMWLYLCRQRLAAPLLNRHRRYVVHWPHLCAYSYYVAQALVAQPPSLVAGSPASPPPLSPSFDPLLSLSPSSPSSVSSPNGALSLAGDGRMRASTAAGFDFDASLQLLPWLFRQYSKKGMLRCTAWLPTSSHSRGALFAAGGDDKLIRIWCLPDDKKAMRDKKSLPFRKSSRSLRGHQGAVTLLASSPQLPDLLVSASASDKSARLWSIDNRRLLLTVDTAELGHVADVRTSAVQKSFFLAGARIGVFDIATGQTILSLGSTRSRSKRPSKPSSSSSSSSRHRSSKPSFECLEHVDLDASVLYSGGSDGAVKIFDVRSRSPLVRVLRAHGRSSSAVSALSMNVFTNSLLVASDAGVALWDLRSVQPKRRHGPSLVFGGQPGHVIAMASDWKRLLAVSLDSSVVMWDVHSPAQPPRVLRQAPALASPSVAKDDGWSVPSVASVWPTQSPKGSQLLTRAAIDPSSFRVAMAGDRNCAVFCPQLSLADQQALAARHQQLAESRTSRNKVESE